MADVGTSLIGTARSAGACSVYETAPLLEVLLQDLDMQLKGMP